MGGGPAGVPSLLCGVCDCLVPILSIHKRGGAGGMGRELGGQTADQLRAGGKTASGSRDGLVFSRCSGSARGGVCTPVLRNPQVSLANPCVQGFLFANSLPAPNPASPNNRESPSPKANASGKMREGGYIPRDQENTGHP